jgi:hypothetical protein
MDKQLLKAYIRTIVEEEVKRVLPELLAEAVTEIKQLQESAPATQPRPGVNRTRMAELMGIDYDGETIRATGVNSAPVLVDPNRGNPEVVKKINRDYSALMKKMGLT